MRKVLAVVAVAVGLLTGACSSAESPDPAPNLFGEYLGATNVKNDRFVSTGSSEDRIANFAAYYSAGQLKSKLLAAFRCSVGTTSQKRSGGYFDTSCDLNSPVRKAIEGVGGSAQDVHGRAVLVKRENGDLELLTLYLAGGRAIDSTGKTYGGLPDFREHNDLLGPDDVILVLRDITAIPGEGEIATVYGHTTSPWPWWVLGGAGAVLLGAVVLVVLRRRRPRSPWS